MAGGAKRPIIIGLAGGSGSGKTTIADAVAQSFGRDEVVMMQHDAYYRDLDDLGGVPAAINFDHPDSLESELLADHLDALRRGAGVAVPVYDYTTCRRTEDLVLVDPAPVMLVEGILALAVPELRARFDLAVFVDAEADLRLIRRISRDVGERGRSAQSVIAQYEATVRPMHLAFVEPSKVHADIIIPNGFNTAAVGAIVGLIDSHLRGQLPFKPRTA